MSVRVNLLPHRAERRKAQRKHLAILAGMVAALGIAIVVLVHGIIAAQIAFQTERNDFLKKENARLDKEIEEIKTLREQIAALLARKQVIERLQTDRSQSVYLLEQMVKQMPDGVYLKTMRQAGLRVNLQGYAQSNARVSTLMRNLSASPFLQNPELIEIKSAQVGSKRVSEFNMNVSLKPPQSDDKGGDKGGKAAAGPAAAPAAADAAKKG